jgi:Zn-finger nucleic acid-binding protein
MNCPICNVTLLLSEKQGVEIDYCPQCRGIWLDKGDLEKIVERSNSSGFNNNGGFIPNNNQYDDHDENQFQNGQRKKRGLFDFFD